MFTVLLCCLFVPWGPQLWKTIIFLSEPLCLHPVLLQEVVEGLANVYKWKHQNLFVVSAICKYLIAYKLFKSNLARVLRTSNHILILAAMAIFGHIFPFLWACHWLFTVITYVKFLFAHSHFCKNHIYSPTPPAWLSYSNQQNSTEEAFLLQLHHLFLGCSPPRPLPQLQHLSPIVTEHLLCARCSSFQSSEQLIREIGQY